MYNDEKMSNVLDSVRMRGFIIGSFSQDKGLSVSSSAVLHKDAVAARAEAKRLSAANPGKMFIMLQLSGAELVPAAASISV